MLKETHLDLCTHKAYFSEWLNYGYIETMRACGGHGFSILSGVANMLVDDFPYMILEGENSVLFLQVAKDLLSLLRKVSTGSDSKIS